MKLFKTIVEYCNELKQHVMNLYHGSHSEEGLYQSHLNFGHFNNIVISVHEPERDISVPHFHFYRGKAIPTVTMPNEYYIPIPRSGMGGGCIMIKEPKCYKHGSHQDTLTSDEIRGLISFMESTDGQRTKWSEIVRAWYRSEPEGSVDWKSIGSVPIPDYTKLQ